MNICGVEYFLGVNIFPGWIFFRVTIFRSEYFSDVNIFHLSTHSLNIWVSHYLLGLVCILYFNSGVCWIEWRVGICRRHRVLPPLSLLVQPLLPPRSKYFRLFHGLCFLKSVTKIFAHICLFKCLLRCLLTPF